MEKIKEQFVVENKELLDKVPVDILKKVVEIEELLHTNLHTFSMEKIHKEDVIKKGFVDSDRLELLFKSIDKEYEIDTEWKTRCYDDEACKLYGYYGGGFKDYPLSDNPFDVPELSPTNSEFYSLAYDNIMLGTRFDSMVDDYATCLWNVEYNYGVKFPKGFHSNAFDKWDTIDDNVMLLKEVLVEKVHSDDVETSVNKKGKLCVNKGNGKKISDELTL